VLFRLFPWVEGALPPEEGGPLHVPRVLQGGGRHDNPDRYPAFYASRVQESVVAERLKRLRGQTIGDRDLRDHAGRPYAVAALDDAGLGRLLDLDDPSTLVERELRPSGVATRNRRVTRRIALRLYEEGANGFEWWSTVEASWINVTLFADRAVGRLRVVGPPEPLAVDHPAVRTAAEAVGVTLVR
jgi:hypothetical protein